MEHSLQSKETPQPTIALLEKMKSEKKFILFVQWAKARAGLPMRHTLVSVLLYKLKANKIPSVIRQRVFFLSISPGYFKQYAELSEHSGRTFNLCIPALP